MLILKLLFIIKKNSNTFEVCKFNDNIIIDIHALLFSYPICYSLDLKFKYS